jgi:hypothetical protein
VERVLEVIDDVAGVHLHDLPPLTTLFVWTRNSSYEIVVVKGPNTYIQRGTHFPDPSPAYLDGANIGGSLLRVGWIGVGFPMETRAAGQHVVTTPVRAITTKRRGLATVH